MVGRKQKIVLEGFTVSVGKLIVEHEAGDFDGQALSENVRNALGQAISAPARLLAPANNSAANSAVVHPPVETRSKSRRRRRVANAQQTDDGQENSDRTSRVRGNSARGLIEELKSHGFFAQDRSIAEIREELHTKGHTFKSNEVSPVLLSLTQQKVLARKKDEDGKWVYRDG